MTTDDLYAGTTETTEGRVFTVTGQDWDSIVEGLARPRAPTSGSWSTWDRSTRPPTACSG